MDRLRALAYAGGVAVAVFAYLALPLLQELYGQVVNLPVYAVIALLAGGVTYSAIRRVQAYAERREEQTPGENEVLVQGELYRVGPDDGDDAAGDGSTPDVDVETEMEQLREDR